MLWECKTNDYSETFPDRLPDSAKDVYTRFKDIDFGTDGAFLSRANVGEPTTHRNAIMAGGDAPLSSDGPVWTPRSNRRNSSPMADVGAWEEFRSESDESDMNWQIYNKDRGGQRPCVELYLSVHFARVRTPLSQTTDS